MTQDAPTPPQSAGAAERDARLKAARQHDAELREAQYTRKLTLAILSTLQNKGVLSSAEVDSILLAARRATDAAMANVTPTAAVRADFETTEAVPVKPDSWVKTAPKAPPVFDIQID